MTRDTPVSVHSRASSRRRVLAAAGGTLAAGLAGCGLLETRTVRPPPLVEDRPDAVYVPTHVEGMEMAGTGGAGRYRFALSYSFPHRFWQVTGDRTNQVTLDGNSTIHLMLTAWDAETGRVLPASNQSVAVRSDGETHVDRRLWPMLSQNMGVHFGDNVALPGDGTYRATVRFGPVGFRTAGALAGAFSDQVTVAIDFEFRQSTLDSLSYRRLTDRAGSRDAVEHMSMEMVPVATTPSVAALPGTVLGQATSGDAVLVATRLSSPPAGVEGDGPYLAVSARTPYNGYPLPFMSLSATVSGAGRSATVDLRGTLDHRLGYHYGAVLTDDGAIGAVDIDPGAPPQLSRHEGYETAFLTMPAVTITP